MYLSARQITQVTSGGAYLVRRQAEKSLFPYESAVLSLARSGKTFALELTPVTNGK